MPNFPSIYLELQELWNAIKKVSEKGTAIEGIAGGILYGAYPDNITKLQALPQTNGVEIEGGANIINGSVEIDPKYGVNTYQIDNISHALSIFNTASISSSDNSYLDVDGTVYEKYPFPDLTIGQDPQIKDKYHTVQISPGKDPDISSLNIVSGTEQIELYITSSLQNGTNTHLQSSDILNVNLNNNKVIIGSASFTTTDSQHELLRVGKTNTNNPVYMSVTDNTGSVILGYHSGGYGAYIGTSGSSEANNDFFIMTDYKKRLGVLSDGRVAISGSNIEGWGAVQGYPLTVGALDFGTLKSGSLFAHGHINAGNYLRLRNAGSSVLLDSSNAPLITRGSNPFDKNDITVDTFKYGHGRWGLFMDPEFLVLGIPNITSPVKYISLSSYEQNGTRNDLFAVGTNKTSNLNTVTFINNPSTLASASLTINASGPETGILLKNNRTLANSASLSISSTEDSSSIETTGKDEKHTLAIYTSGSLAATFSTASINFYETTNFTRPVNMDYTLTFDEGQGIKFGGSNDELDVYEDGTWNLEHDGITGTTDVVLYVNSTYTRIGDLVYVYIRLWGVKANDSFAQITFPEGSWVTLPVAPVYNTPIQIQREWKAAGEFDTGIYWGELRDDGKFYFKNGFSNYTTNRGGGRVIIQAAYRTP